MKEPILDESFEIFDAKAAFQLRTKDLEIIEVIIFSSAVLFLLWNVKDGILMNYNWEALVLMIVQTSLFLLMPITYTWIWRKRSIKIDASSEKEDPQTALTFILGICTSIECMICFIFAIMAVTSDSFEDYSQNILNWMILILAVLCFYYVIRSFNQGKNIDKYIVAKKKKQLS